MRHPLQDSDIPKQERQSAGAIRFIEKNLKHTQGRAAGEPFLLEDFQKEILQGIFQCHPPNSHGEYLRKHLESFIFMARKNGKTELLAAILLYVLFFDGWWTEQDDHFHYEQRGEIYIAAHDYKQASLLFDTCVAMLNKSAHLLPFVDISGVKKTSTSKVIRHKLSNSHIIVLSQGGDSKMGQNPSFVCYDESHTVYDEGKLYNTFLTGNIARNQFHICSISTAGDNTGSLCRLLYDESKRVETARKEGDEKNSKPSLYYKIYELDNGDRWDDPQVWHRANPALGSFLRMENLKANYNAIGGALTENEFINFHCNRWTKGGTKHLPLDLWDKAKASYTPEELEGLPCYMAVDIGSRSDLTAISLAFQTDEGIKLLVYAMTNDQDLQTRSKRHKIPYQRWADDGWLILSHGAVVDFTYLEEFIVDLSKKYEVKELAVDKANQGEPVLQRLTYVHNLNAFAYPDWWDTWSPASHRFIDACKAGELFHDGNPVLRHAVDCVEWRQNAKKIKPYGRKDWQKVDALIASIMAVDRLLVNSTEVPKDSKNVAVYDWGDILSAL